MTEFKAESKRLLDLMINSIYTNKEIFLRELISNCSDALDKQHFTSLTDSKATDDFAITVQIDKDNRILSIIDNGIGMTKKEMEDNLGTIAKSGTYDFKKENGSEETLIGQFGVGFYSAFMVADTVTVISKAYKTETAYKWTSSGADGYEIEEAIKPTSGTMIILHLKNNDEDCNYDEFLDQYKIQELIKKYSDYIRYPIRMEMEQSKLKENSSEDKPEYEKVIEVTTLNSMLPIWKKPKSDVTEAEYEDFYKNNFHDYLAPLKRISAKLEGTLSYETLLFIPSKKPMDYHSKDFKKGLALYSNGVMIMEKCADLLPDYLGFVKGVVDCGDLSLNISREILQHNRQLKTIASSLEKKIIAEIKKMVKSETEREVYDKIFAEFGESIKFGAYDNFGEKKDQLQDILMFKNSNSEKYSTFEEYESRMKEGQTNIFYACGENVSQISRLPKTENVLKMGFEVLYLTDAIDEFVMKVLGEFKDKKIKSVSDAAQEIDTEEQKKEVSEKTEQSKELLKFMKKALGVKVKAVKLTAKISDHAVSMSTEGEVSLEMEKVFASMREGDSIKANKILEINPNHPIFEKLTLLFESDKNKVTDYANLLYSTALLQEGIELKDNVEFAALIQKLL